MRPAVRQALFSGGPSWLPKAAGKKPLLFADTTTEGGNNRYWYQGRRYSSFATWLSAVGGSFARTSTGWYFNSSGLLVSVSGGVTRFNYGPGSTTLNGLLIEPIRKNDVLWSRDLTNAAWTASNITAAKDQIGLDGSANSASSITATAGNGTILQAITATSAQRAQSVYVKRITGAGVVEMTMDNGSTWTAIAVTASWARVTIPAQTLANPTVGFRIVTSGDAVAIDVVQNEVAVGATPGPSSPIVTTSAAVQRERDDLNLGVGWVNVAASTWLLGISDQTSVNSAHVLDCIRSNGVDRLVDVTITANSVNGSTFVSSSQLANLTDSSNYLYTAAAKIVYSSQPGSAVLAVNGGSAQAGTPASMPALANLTQTAIGRYYPDSSTPMCGHLQSFGYWPVAVASQEVTRLSGPFLASAAQQASRMIALGDSQALGSGATSGNTWLQVAAGTLVRNYFNAGVAGTTSTQAKIAQAADTEHLGWTHIYFTGTNNASPAQTVLDDIDAMILRQTTARHLVCVPLQNSANAVGSAGYNNIAALQTAIRDHYPSNLIDTPVLVGVDGDGYTVAGSSADGLHLNNAGQALLAAGVVSAMQSNGW